MIAELADRVAADLAARKFPHRVSYAPGPVRFDSPVHPAVVFFRDRESGDGITPPTGWKGSPNPRAMFDRRFRGIALVYAKSARAGAQERDHEDECDMVCDGVLTAIYAVSKGHLLEVQSSRILRPEEVDLGPAQEQRAPHGARTGCVAELRFSLASPVRRLDYTGAGPLTGEIFSVDAPTIESPGFPDTDPVP